MAFPTPVARLCDRSKQAGSLQQFAEEGCWEEEILFFFLTKYCVCLEAVSSQKGRINTAVFQPCG